MGLRSVAAAEWPVVLVRDGVWAVAVVARRIPWVP